jgi:hypothetical protein
MNRIVRGAGPTDKRLSGTDTLAFVICPEREASAVDEPACWRLRA